MQLQHKFELPISARDTWALLNRVEDITPCLPGATATRVDDEHFNITMKIRFGPLDLMFKGMVEIVERDDAAYRLVIKTKANDAKGQGSASGTTTATIAEEGGVTHVVLDTELMIGGRIAQMGRGMVAEVSNELLGRFVGNLKAKLLADSKANAAPAVASGEAVEPAEEYVDVGAAVRRAMWRRLVDWIFFWRKAK